MMYRKYLAGFVMIGALFTIVSCRRSDAERNTFRRSNIAVRPVHVKVDSSEATAAKDTTLADTAVFNAIQMHLVHGKATSKWPVRAGFPLKGSILPFKRIVAYYGNFYSAGMGILGEVPEDELIQKLQKEVEEWRQADTMIPVVPAIHYIAVTAQHSPGKGAKYRLRMPGPQIDRALALATRINGILFLDVQVGHSRLEDELPLLEPYLRLPEVHLGIDPEFSMKGGQVPSTTIGYYDAADINYAISFLQAMVKKYNLPPKVLVVHRFTKGMVTNYRNIKLCREVQVVVNMDGFGFPAKKIDSYNTAVAAEPIQYTGFKLFYKNDKLSRPYRLMKPAEILKLTPSPIYIQYQ